MTHRSRYRSVSGCAPPCSIAALAAMYVTQICMSCAAPLCHCRQSRNAAKARLAFCCVPRGTPTDRCFLVARRQRQPSHTSMCCVSTASGRRPPHCRPTAAPALTSQRGRSAEPPHHIGLRSGGSPPLANPRQDRPSEQKKSYICENSIKKWQGH